MDKILIVYSTTDGQTKKICEKIIKTGKKKQRIDILSIDDACDLSIDGYRKIRDCVENTVDKSVIVVGDVMLDRYIYGFANNLNTTAPVPVLKETDRKSGAGAAAHVARSLFDLGLKPKP